MKDLLQEKQHKRRDGLKFTLTLIFVLSVTGIIVKYGLPEQTQELPNINMDFDDQDTINRNGSMWNIDKDTIVEGTPIELEKDI